MPLRFGPRASVYSGGSYPRPAVKAAPELPRAKVELLSPEAVRAEGHRQWIGNPDESFEYGNLATM